MNRQQATQELRSLLDSVGLPDWHIRLNTSVTTRYIGLTSHKDKCIILNAHHVDSHPEPDIINTIRHEVAHAVVGPNHGHDEIWSSKAKELGCDNTSPCLSYGLSLEVIDAIRSGADVEVTFEEEIIRKPSYKITRLQDKCEECGKVAEELFSFEAPDTDGNDCKFITLKCGHLIKKIIPRATPFHEMITAAHVGNNCDHQWNKNHCPVCDAYRPYEFQIEGARFLEKSLATQKGGALFDEMGLGKTIQILTYIKYHPEKLPVLFIVKSSVKYQFMKEIIRWLGLDYFPQVINTGKDPVLPGFKCYIVSYDLIKSYDPEKIKSLNLKLVILDECQQIKNPDSTRTQEVRKIVREMQVVPLSATPWKNRGSEFFTVLNMMDPVRFPYFSQYCNRWVDYYWQGNKYKEGGIRNPEKFKELVRDIVIRRERKEVLSELPEVNRVKFYIKMGDIEEATYQEEEDKFIRWYKDSVLEGRDTNNILAKLSRMRHLIGLAKIPATLELIDEFKDDGRKVVIFLHHKDVAQILTNDIKERVNGEVPLFIMSSELNSQSRYQVQEDFNNSDRAIMIASTLAAGEGLNLQTCDYCIFHERQWNPANEEQAEGRFIRIGQKSTSVTAQYVVATGSIDEFSDQIVERKRLTFHAAMSSGEVPAWKESEIIGELAEMIMKNRRKKR